MPTIFSNPRGPKPTQPLGASENIQNPLGTGYLIPWDGGAKIVRAPIFTGIVKVFALAALVSQAPVNLLTNTLGTPAAPAQPPFAQTDWPNPVVKKADVTNRTWLQQLTVNLLGKDQIHGAPGESKTYDYPNPTLAKRAPQDFTDSFNLPLLGRDQFFYSQGQAPNYDYPNPQVPRRSVQDHSQNLLESTLAPAVGAQPPFFQTDWPNPTQKKPDIRGSTASVNLNILGKDQFYGAAGQPPTYDYPNPVLRKVQRQDYLGSVNLNLLQPFAQTDWPNPTLKKPDIRGAVYGVNLNILGEDQFFGAAGQPPTYDYPNPRTARRGPPDQSISLLQSTLAPVVVAGNPFSQTEWPNPIRRHAQRLGNFYHRIGTATGAGASPPLANTPWANPVGKPNREAERSQLPRNTSAMIEDFVAFSAMQDTPNRVSRIHVDSQQSGVKPQFIQVQAAPPFVPVDFPNPALRKPLALTWTQNLATLNLTGDKPFPNYDFPNPQRPGPRQYWLFSEVQFIPAPVVQAPFYQTNWPNPLQPRRKPHEWAQNLVQTPAGLAGIKPFPNSDFPNPQPTRRIRQDLALQLNLPIITPPPVVAGGTHHKRKWRRSG